jgi:hypothetical protein
MISTVQGIIALTTEADLLKEMAAFETAADKRIAPIEKLLAVDIRSTEETTVQNHMTAIDAHRQAAVRIYALAACFLEHAKSPYFGLATKGTEFERSSKQKQIIAPFTGMSVRYEGLVRSIDSRVNLCKVLLRVSGDNTTNTNIN